MDINEAFEHKVKRGLKKTFSLRKIANVSFFFISYFKLPCIYMNFPYDFIKKFLSLIYFFYKSNFFTTFVNHCNLFFFFCFLNQESGGGHNGLDNSWSRARDEGASWFYNSSGWGERK